MRKAILLFGLIGPVIGSFVFVATLSLQNAEFQNLSVSEIGSIGFGILVTLFFSIWGIPFAILLGMVPAGVSGYAYWIILRKLERANLSTTNRFLIGSTTSLITTTILFVVFYSYNYFYHDSKESFSYGWWFFAWPGYISGGVCGLLVKIKNTA